MKCYISFANLYYVVYIWKHIWEIEHMLIYDVCTKSIGSVYQSSRNYDEQQVKFHGDDNIIYYRIRLNYIAKL